MQGNSATVPSPTERTPGSVLSSPTNSIVVEDTHFRYLALQKGRLSEFSAQRQEWERAYVDSLRGDLKMLKPHLPGRCCSILDIGSGLGGIDILLDRYYGGGTSITLLDGEKDKPRMVRHRDTYNDMSVAEDFLRKNDVAYVRTISPKKLGLAMAQDLIISLGSWCFHYPPAVYLEYVRKCCHPTTVVIVDVRTGRADYLQQLAKAFDSVTVAAHLRKATRWVLRPKA